MSSFSNNFERAEQNDVQFDDNAFYPVLATCIIFCFFVCVYLVIKGLLSKFKYVNENEFINCKCNKCKSKLERCNRKAKTRKYRMIIYIFMLILLGISFCFCYNQIVSTQGKVKSFDPYDILGVSIGDDIKVIKKQYKKLALMYHPDKNLNNLQAKAQFMLVTKAYNALTDDESKKNYELYGNPDGPSSMRVSVGLPSFVLNKKHHLKILLIFLIIVIVFIPYYFFKWYNQTKLYDSNGYLISTSEQFAYLTNESTSIYHIPFIIGLASDFNQFIVKNEEKDLIDKTYAKFAKTIPEYKNELSLSQKKAITIGYCYSYRLNVEFIYYDDYITLFARLIDQFFITQYEKYSLCLYIQQTRQMLPEDLKLIDINFLKHTLTFQQHFFQGVNFRALANPNHAYMQLPHFTLDHITNKEGIMPFNEFIKANKKKKREILQNSFNIKPNEIEDVYEATKAFPIYEYKLEKYVDGFEEFVYGDLATFQLTIRRQNIGQKKIGLGHSVNYPGVFNECIQIFVINGGRVLMEKMIEVNKKVSTFEFQIKLEKVGKLPIDLEIVPTCYLGLNTLLQSEVIVEQQSQKRREFLKSIDKRKVKVEPSFFQSMLKDAGFIMDTGSDEEEETELEGEGEEMKKIPEKETDKQPLQDEKDNTSINPKPKHD